MAVHSAAVLARLMEAALQAYLNNVSLEASAVSETAFEFSNAPGIAILSRPKITTLRAEVNPALTPINQKQSSRKEQAPSITHHHPEIAGGRG